MVNRITNTISMLKGLDQETLQGWRYTLFFFIILDMGLFYWWMEWKKFSIALMVVCLIALSVILMLERKFPPEEIEETKDDKSKLAPVMNNKPSEEKPKDSLYIDLGLPNSQDYNERLEEAISN